MHIPLYNLPWRHRREIDVDLLIRNFADNGGRANASPRQLYTRMQKISPPPGFGLRIVQPVASRYTDWAIPVPIWHDSWLAFWRL